MPHDLALALGRATVRLPWPAPDPPAMRVPGPVAEPAADLPALAASAVAGLPLGARDPLLLVVPDRTRACPLPDLLRAVFAALADRGVAPARVRLAVASGTHIPSDDDFAPARLGPLPAGVTVVRHDASAPAHDFGTSPAGTPARAHPALAEAGAILVLGGTAFHYFAGFGGGWKMLFPGLGERAAIAANHRRSLGPWPPGGLAAGVEPGRLAGNPVAEDLRAVAALLPPAVHLTTWDGGRRAAVWRDPSGFESVAARYAAPRRAGPAHGCDLAVASAGGFPRDLDVVQSHKALFHASRFVRPGGAIVLLAACEEGVGSTALARWLTRPDLATLEAEARAAYDLNAQTAVSLAAIARRWRVTWAGAPAHAGLARLGFRFEPDPARALADARAWADAERGGRARAIVLPRATEVLPALP